jgi:hypothetical protein
MSHFVNDKKFIHNFYPFLFDLLYGVVNMPCKLRLKAIPFLTINLLLLHGWKMEK